MAYHFKLETILGLRRNFEELAQQKLARELMTLEAHRQRLSVVRGEREALIGEFEEKKRGLLPSALFVFYMEAIAGKEREIVTVAALVESQRLEVVKAREALAARVKEKKVMEKVRERDFQKYMQERLKKEQKEADEQMVLRFGRHGKVF